MKLLRTLPLVLPFACLALLSVIALLSIAAIGAAVIAVTEIRVRSVR